MEINQVNNQELLSNIIDTAIEFLLSNGFITQNELKGLKVDIGYLFSFDNGENEGLFKIIYNSKIFYFAVQEGNLIMLKFNETLYNQTVNDMKQMHPCIENVEPIETDIQRQRRIKNVTIAKNKNISTYDNKVSLWEDSQVVLKDKDTICKRALACFFTMQIACDIACDIEKNNYKESIQYFKPIIENYGLMDCLNSKEKRIIDGTYTTQDAIDLDWAYEAYWSICWCLGLVNDISNASMICDCSKAIEFVATCHSVQEFINKCNLRSKSEILDMLDLYYRYEWAINDTKVNPNSSSGDLDHSIVKERRRGLEWIVSDIDDWYELKMIG